LSDSILSVSISASLRSQSVDVDLASFMSSCDFSSLTAENGFAKTGCFGSGYFGYFFRFLSAEKVSRGFFRSGFFGEVTFFSCYDINFALWSEVLRF